MNRSTWYRLLLFCFLLLTLALHVQAQISQPTDTALSETDPVVHTRISETYGKLPLSFELNQGQTDGRVKFLSRGIGYSLFLTSNEAILTLRIADCGLRIKDSGSKDHSGLSKLETRNSQLETVLRMRLVGASPAPQVVGLDELLSKSNYFIGNDPQQWRTAVPQYARVAYQHVYPGVNLIYYGSQQQLEYDFIVAPGADPGIIRVAFEGINKLHIDARGDLVLDTKSGQIRQHKPIFYQEVDGVRQMIPGRYVRKGKRQVGFAVANYDTSKPLVIDPVLRYATYLGGSNHNQGLSIAVDTFGNAYVTGSTDSVNFPTTSPFQAMRGGAYDVFVSKLNASGSALVYSTYLGGSGDDVGLGIAVDSANGTVYVTGYTYSSNFPTASPLQPTYGGFSDAFVAKLNASGSALVYSTYLGGSSSDEGRGIAVDAAGNAYVTGYTGSPNFRTVNPFQPTRAGGYDAFVAKLNPAGSALVYSTYLGGNGNDYGNAIAVDAPGNNAYVTGVTDSTNFPTTAGSFRGTMAGDLDAFVTKLNAAGSALVYSTYLGGSGIDQGHSIAVDSSGGAYVTGLTNSLNFPTANPVQASYGGGGADAFVTKLNAAGSALVYSTFLGGNRFDYGNGIAVDPLNGTANVIGYTNSPNFPTANPAQNSPGGGDDAFVTRISASGSALVYSTYLGGSGSDEGRGIAIGASGNTYVTGYTQSRDFPTTSDVFQTALRGPSNAFVAKIFPEDCLAAPTAQTPSGATASHRPTFTWSAVTGATEYTVIFALLNTPEDIQLVGTSQTTSLTPTFDIPDGDYLWIVSAASPSCETSPLSEPKLFTIPGTCPLAAPTLLNPPDASSVSSPVELRWSAVPGASFYFLFVANAATGDLVIVEALTTTTFMATLPRGLYSWEVYGWNSTCDAGPTSPLRGFAVQ